MTSVFWDRSLAVSLVWLGLIAVRPESVAADVVLPNIFGDHMVLQQGQKNPVWGTAAADESVTVSIGDQKHQTKAASDGKWRVQLDPLPVGGPHELKVQGSNALTFTDVLVGEVWICSGQSNMEWSVASSNDFELERVAAKHPQIRMIGYPNVGTQEPVWTHNTQWKVCSPDSVGEFSAVGYFFGRQLLETIDVPIGLINNAWGGSACDAWVNREVLKADARFAGLLERWSREEARFAELSAKTDRNDQENKDLENLKRQMSGNARPGNLYNGILLSHLGYGIRGAIWYQGESNAGRAYQYRDLFPTMISNWRKEWGQGDFPFYWVQLADFQAEVAEPSDSAWAELREAQTMTMTKLPNTGEAVIIDIGEGKDIHPMNKVDVGRRLARWALANQYDVPVPFHSPQYKAFEKVDNKIVLKFDHVGPGWRPFDVNEPVGFAIAGEDKKFVWAKAKILPENMIEVASDQVPNPVAVRYAWANNPVCNMYSRNGLPLTPFRTDDWPGVTANNQ